MLIDLARPLWRLLPISIPTRKRIKAWFVLRVPGLARATPPPQCAEPAAPSEWDGDWEGLFPLPVENPSRVLVVDWKPPMPDRDSGSFRMRKLLECLIEGGIRVDFIGDVPALEDAYVEQLQALGIRVEIGMPAATELLKGQGGDYRTVLLSRPEVAELYLPLVRAYAPMARVVYDTVDLHWVRFERGARIDTDPAELLARSSDYRRLEMSNARSADVTLAISEDERAILLAEDPGITVAVVPNVHEVVGTRTPFADRRGLFFIGGFDHAPNVDAVRFLVSDILPAVRARLGDVELHVVGSNPPEEISQLASDAVRIEGFVRDVGPWFERSRVFVAPLRQGAGMKGKIGHSLSHGLPLVTTRIGAEGIGLVDGENAFVADDPRELADKVVALYQDPELWQRFSSAGMELLRTRFSMAAVRTPLLTALGLETPAPGDRQGAPLDRGAAAAAATAPT